jgi:hypothetical protein
VTRQRLFPAIHHILTFAGEACRLDKEAFTKDGERCYCRELR